MTKTIDGNTYELVSEKIEGTALTNFNCYSCVAIGDINLCVALGMDCLSKGFWNEATT